MTSRGFDPVLLRSFLAVASANSFTAAGRKLGLQQSTVSQHIKRLERAVGRRLLVRDTHTVTLTADGAAMLEFEQRILEIEARAHAHFAASALRGRVRLGVSEDFVMSRLSSVLKSFRRSNPSVDLELSVGLAEPLYEKLESGELDLLFSKRRKGDDRGETVWREKLVWIASEDFDFWADRPVPLVTFPPPSITRSNAIEALENAGREWRITCTSGSLSGILAAVEAGLGISAQSRHLTPLSLIVPQADANLPELGEVEFVVVSATRAMAPPVAALSKVILDGALGLSER
ncbi:MAG: LysR family transcriptional regulator [Oricola sp.]|nr:LysR family transcriptional regulator [Oricola sp.]